MKEGQGEEEEEEEEGKKEEKRKGEDEYADGSTDIDVAYTAAGESD